MSIMQEQWKCLPFVPTVEKITVFVFYELNLHQSEKKQKSADFVSSIRAKNEMRKFVFKNTDTKRPKHTN